MIHQKRKGKEGSLPEGLYLFKQEETMWPASANVLLIPDGNGVTLVDVGCGQEEVYLRLKEFLCSCGFRIEDVHTVVLTHAHPDHMGAMRCLLEEASPRIYLHPLEIPLAAEPSRLNHTFDMALPCRYGMAAIPREQADIIEYFQAFCPMARVEATHCCPEKPSPWVNFPLKRSSLPDMPPAWSPFSSEERGCSFPPMPWARW